MYFNSVTFNIVQMGMMMPVLSGYNKLEQFILKQTQKSLDVLIEIVFKYM